MNFIIRLVIAVALLSVSHGVTADQGQFRYLIEFDEPGMLQAQQRAPGERFDPTAPAAVARLAELQVQQAAHRAAIAGALGRTPVVTHHYVATHSGIAVWLSEQEAAIVRGLSGVASVERERIETIETFRGPSFIGADAIWSGAAVRDGVGTRGAGMVVAILDTGVDPGHPSFANDAMCGHGDAYPDKLIGFVDCAISGPDGRCSGPLPTDTQSHGSHVASTAAGNTLDGTADPAPAPYAQISGVASCASIRSYKVCPDISCPASMIQAGMDNVLLDGDVDVMNFSISGGRNPWSDNDRRKLDLVAAGVVVAAAAGNHDPLTDPETVGRVNHLGPWVFTVAASTHDGAGGTTPTLAVAGPGTPPSALTAITMNKGSAEVGQVPDGSPFTGVPLRRFDDPLGEEAEGCVPFPPGYFDGAVALIARGTCTFTNKVHHAELAGAVMVVIRNNEPGALTGWNAGVPSIPAYGVSQADGEALVAWLAQHPDAVTVDFDFVAAGGSGGDVLAGFSLRGPTPSPVQNLQKPDIAAPGVSIFAAEPMLFGLGDPYGYKSGTSMASPHAAGAAALVRAIHPGWTAPEVKSALMMSARNPGLRADEVTPWDADDVGSGRVDLTRAALAGLVLHETFDNFLAANPASGGDVRTLNLPAVRDMGCTPSCSWTRTVRNTLGTPASWTVSGGDDRVAISVTPSSFTFSGDPTETQALVITATPRGDQTAAVAFSEVVFREGGGHSPDLHFSVAVRGSGDGGGPGEPPTSTTVADTDPAVEYQRGWHRRDGGAIGGTHHRRMGNAGGGDAPTVRLVFEGDAITYHYGTSEQGGLADVYLNGAFAGTVDHSGTAKGNAPAFGSHRTFDGLGDGAHEFLLVFRSGAVYVDGFEIHAGGADEQAAATRSSTAATGAAIPLLGAYLQTVDVPAQASWLSVVVEGHAQGVTVLDPSGAVAAVGGVLAAGTVGADVAPVAGRYVVQVTGAAGKRVEVSVATELRR